MFQNSRVVLECFCHVLMVYGDRGKSFVVRFYGGSTVVLVIIHGLVFVLQDGLTMVQFCSVFILRVV